MIDLEIKAESISVDIQVGKIEITGTDLSALMKEILKNEPISNLLDAISDVWNDTEFDQFVEWIDENYDFSSLISENLGDERVQEIIAELNKK